MLQVLGKFENNINESSEFGRGWGLGMGVNSNLGIAEQSYR